MLATYGARATFFVVGDKVAAQPDLVRALVTAGHEVAHHTQTHPVSTFWCASSARVRRELDRGTATLLAAGVRPTRFRPPAGLRNLWLKRALAARGLACIGWSARGLERRGGDVGSVVERVTRGVAPGSILLLHEGRGLPQPIRLLAIEQVLARLQALGYRCVVPTPAQLGAQAAVSARTLL